MGNIVRGAVIAGRYVVSDLEHPWIHERPELGTVCTAIDAILDEPVTAYVAPTESSGDVLDAARRAALINDVRFPRILDVGRDETGWDFCITEASGASWLRDLVNHGPLTPGQTRALIGEVAQALAVASRRGLHHLRLGPESISVDEDGSVHVHGLAIDAAVADFTATTHLDSITMVQARREDALALLDLLYLVTTAHWPGEESRDGFPPAERPQGVPLPARAYNDGVDEAIGRLLESVMTGRERGPQSAAELATFLQPWDREDLRGLTSRKPPAQGTRTAAEPVLPAAQEAAPAKAPSTEPQGTTPPSTAAAIPPAPERTRATPAQLQAAKRRIGRAERPGTRGLAAGILGQDSHDPFNEELSMRAASTFPVDAAVLREAEENTSPWEPESFDRQPTGTQPASAQASQLAEPEEDDASWFLGGMFTTDEEQDRQEEERLLREEQELERIRRRLAESDDDRRPGATARNQTGEDASAPPTQQFPVIRDDVPTMEFRPPHDDDRREPAAKHAGHTASGGRAAVPGAAEPAGQRAGEGVHDADADAAKPDGSVPSPLSLKGTAPQKPEGKRPVVSPAHSAAPASSRQARTAPRGANGASPKPAGGISRAPALRASSPADRPAASSTVPPSGSGRPPGGDSQRRRSRVALLLIVIAMIAIVGIVIGVIVTNTGADDEASSVPPSVAGEETPDEDDDQSEEAETVSPVVAGAEDLDPEGDGFEKPELTSNVLPGASGSWQTDTYNSPEFGGLKSGLGLRIELEEESDVAAVEVESPAPGGEFEIRAGSDDPLSAEVLGSGEFENGTARVELDEPLTTSSFFIWITELPADGGGYRAVISEVSATAE